MTLSRKAVLTVKLFLFLSLWAEILGKEPGQEGEDRRGTGFHWDPNKPKETKESPGTANQEQLGKCFSNPNEELREKVRKCRCDVYNGDELQKKVMEIFNEKGEESGGKFPQGGKDGKGRYGRRASFVSSGKFELLVRVKRDSNKQRCSPKPLSFSGVVGRMMVKKCFWDQMSLISGGKIQYDKFKEMFNFFDIEPKVREGIQKAVDNCIKDPGDQEDLPEPVVKIVQILLPKEDISKCMCIEKAMSGICTDGGKDYFKEMKEFMEKFGKAG